MVPFKMVSTIIVLDLILNDRNATIQDNLSTFIFTSNHHSWLPHSFRMSLVILRAPSLPLPSRQHVSQLSFVRIQCGQSQTDLNTHI